MEAASMPVRESASLPSLDQAPRIAGKRTATLPTDTSLQSSTSTVLPSISKHTLSKPTKASSSTGLTKRTTKVRVELCLHRSTDPASSLNKVGYADTQSAGNTIEDAEHLIAGLQIGFVSGTADTTLSWLRVNIAQTPSLSAMPNTYAFLPPETITESKNGGSLPLSEAQEYAVALGSYISEESRSAERPNDPIYEIETKYLLTAATASGGGYGDFETLVKVLVDSETQLISVETLDNMFKQARRAKANQKQLKRGKDLMKRLSDFLHYQRMSIGQWFTAMDSSGAAMANGSITTRELRLGMKQLVAKGEKNPNLNGEKTGGLHSTILNGIQLTEDDITTLLRFMDPSGEGDLSFKEVKDAFDRANTTRPNERIMLHGEKVLRVLDVLMKKRGIKNNDWYEWMDLSGSGVIMIDEFREGYAVIIDPAAHSLPKRSQRDIEKRVARLRRFQHHPIPIVIKIVDTTSTSLLPASEDENAAINLSSDPAGSMFSVQGSINDSDAESAYSEPQGTAKDPEWKYQYLIASDEEIENLVDAFLCFNDSRDHDLGSFLGFVESVAESPDSVHLDVQRVAASFLDILGRLEKEWEHDGATLCTEYEDESTLSIGTSFGTISRNAMLSIVDLLDRKKRGTVNLLELKELFDLSILPATPESSIAAAAPVPSRLAERGLEILAKEGDIGRNLDEILKNGQIDMAAASATGLKGELEFAVREMFRGVEINPDGCMRVKVIEDHFRRARKLKETDKIRVHGRIVARRINSLLLYTDITCAAWIKRGTTAQNLAGRADLDNALKYLVKLTIDRRKMDNEATQSEHKRILKEAHLAASKVSVNAFGQVEKASPVSEELLKSKPKLVDENVAPFGKTDIAALMSFVDPTLGTPIVTSDKFATALLLASRNIQAVERSRLISTELRLAEFLWRIEALMNENNIRFVDLFGSTATGVISSIGMAESLMRIIEPSEKRAEEFSKRAKAAAMDADMERKQYEREASYKRNRYLKREALRKEAETLGVAAVIRAVHHQMSANEVDLPGLIRMLDRNGNRHITSEELIVGLTKVSGPNAAYRAEQLRREKKEAKQRRVMSRRQRERANMQKKMIELERSGVAITMRVLIDYLRRAGNSIENLFKVQDLLLDGESRCISSSSLCDGLWQAGYAVKASDVQTMVKYFDVNGVLAVDTMKLNDALESYMHMQTTCGHANNLYEEYRDLGDIFFSRNIFADGALSRKELKEGLQRLRGDPNPQLWKTQVTWSEANVEDHRRAITKLFEYTREHNVNLLKAFGVSDKQQRIPKDIVTTWLKSLRALRPKLLAQEKIEASPRSENAIEMKKEENYEGELSDRARLADHELAKIMAFLDPEYRDEIVPAMFLDALLLSTTVLQPLEDDLSFVSASRMMRQVFLDPISEAKLEHASLYEVFQENVKIMREAGIGDLFDPGLVLLAVGTTTTRVFDTKGFSASFAIGTSVFTAEVVDDIKRAMLSVNPDGYSLAVLSGSVGYLVDKLEPQIVPLKSVVDRMPAGLAGPAVSTTRGLQNVLEELVIAPPVVWNGAKDETTKEFIWPQLRCDLGAAIAVAHPIASVIVPGLDVRRVPVVTWDGLIFRVIFAGEVITSRSLDARVEILQANGTIDNTKLREAIQSIGETVRTVASVPPNAAVLLIQSGAARSLILTKLERSLRPSTQANDVVQAQDGAKLETDIESKSDDDPKREDCALSAEDVITLVDCIAPSQTDELIGAEEFVRSFRRYKRDKAMAQSVIMARSLLRRVRYAIESKQIGLGQWIKMLGEGTIVGDMRRYTLMHLNASLRYLSEKGSAHKFSKNDAVSIIRYIETDQGEGYFEKETLLQALEATSVGEEEEISKQHAFEQFEIYLKVKNLDVRRMVHDVLDLTHERKLAPAQLKSALEAIMSAGGNPLVAEEKKKMPPKVEILNENEVQQQLRVRHELFSQMQQTGALEPFRHTMNLLHKRGRRPHALMEKLDEKMINRGKTVTTVTRSELCEVLKKYTEPLNEARRFLRKGAKDAGTNPIKESNEFLRRMNELSETGVTKVASTLDDYIRRSPGGFDGVFSFMGPKNQDSDCKEGKKSSNGKTWRFAADEMRLALKKLKVKLTKKDIDKILRYLEGHSSGLSKKKYVYLQDLHDLLKDVRKWTWQVEQSQRPLLSKRELLLITNYISTEADVSVREIRLALQQCKNKKRSVKEIPQKMPSPRPETPSSKIGPVDVIFIIGGPVSGKTTQSKLLAESMGFTFLAQRRDIAEDTESAVRHQYVPPELIVNLLRQGMMENIDKTTTQGFVIEGFPSDRKSAEAWAALNNDFATVRGVIVLDCAVDLMEARFKEQNILPAKIEERIRNWRIHTGKEITSIGEIFPVDIIAADSSIEEVASTILQLFKPREASPGATDSVDSSLADRLLDSVRPGTAPLTLHGDSATVVGGTRAKVQENNDLRRRLIEREAELFEKEARLEALQLELQEARNPKAQQFPLQTNLPSVTVRLRVIAASNLIDLGEEKQPYVLSELVDVVSGALISNTEVFRTENINSSLRTHRVDTVWNTPEFVWSGVSTDIENIVLRVNVYGCGTEDHAIRADGHEAIGGVKIPLWEGLLSEEWHFLSAIDKMDRHATGSIHLRLFSSAHSSAPRPGSKKAASKKPIGSDKTEDKVEDEYEIVDSLGSTRRVATPLVSSHDNDLDQEIMQDSQRVGKTASDQEQEVNSVLEPNLEKADFKETQRIPSSSAIYTVDYGSGVHTMVYE